MEKIMKWWHLPIYLIIPPLFFICLAFVLDFIDIAFRDFLIFVGGVFLGVIISLFKKK